MSEVVRKNTRQLSMGALSQVYAYQTKLLKPSQVFKKNTEEKTQKYAIIVPLVDAQEFDEYGEPLLDASGNPVFSAAPVNTAAVVAKAQLSMDFDRSANIIYGFNEYSTSDEFGGTIIDQTDLEKYREELKLILQAKMERELIAQREKDVAIQDPIVKEQNLARIKASYSTKARYDYAKLLFPSAKDDDELNKFIKASSDFPKRRSFLEDPYSVRLISAALVPLDGNNIIKVGTTKNTVNYVYLKLNSNLVGKMAEAIRTQPELFIEQQTKTGVAKRKYICLVSQYNLPPDGKVTGLSVANFYENINPFKNIGIPGVGDASMIDTKLWNEIICGLTYEEKTLIGRIPEYVADGKARNSGISVKTAISRVKEFIAENVGIFDVLNEDTVKNNKYLARLLVNNKDSDDFVRLRNSKIITAAEQLLDNNDGQSPVEAPLTREEVKHMEEVTSNPVSQHEDTSIIDFG